MSKKVCFTTKKLFYIQKNVILIMILSFLLSSCNYSYYELDYPELFTEATSSLLGVSGDKDDQIYVVETDEYGRKLFVYNGYSSDTKKIFALLICQKSDNKYVYYYSDLNYIICTIDDYFNTNNKITSEIVNKYFSKKDIEALKNHNDWNKEVDTNKCFKVKIYRQKDDPISEKRVREAFKTKNPEKEFDDAYSFYLTSDQNGNSIYFVRGVDNNKKFTKSYIIYFDRKSNFDKEKGIEEVTDIWNYTDQLSKFKEKNGWKKKTN